MTEGWNDEALAGWVPLADDGSGIPLSAKVTVHGGFAHGKSTFISTLSEIPPLNVETGIERSVWSFDIGRLTLDPQLVLYIAAFGGPSRFWREFRSDAYRCVGSCVIVDATRLADAFPSVDRMERTGIPYVVVLNNWGRPLPHDVDAVRDALLLGEDVPLVIADVASRDEALGCLRLLLTTAVAAAKHPRSDQSSVWLAEFLYELPDQLHTLIDHLEPTKESGRLVSLNEVEEAPARWLPRVAEALRSAPDPSALTYPLALYIGNVLAHELGGAWITSEDRTSAGTAPFVIGKFDSNNKYRIVDPFKLASRCTARHDDVDLETVIGKALEEASPL